MGKSSLSVGTKVWADRFNSCLHKSAEGWIAAGNVLIEAKKAVPKGDFHRLIERELHVDARTAQRFMAIATHPVLSNATNLSRLPPTYTVLYQLAKLTERHVQEGLKSGAIHPRMTNEDIIKMVTPRPIIIDVDHEDITPKSGDQRSRSNEPEARRNPSVSGDQQQCADEAGAPAGGTAILAVPGSAVPDATICHSGDNAADDGEEIVDTRHHDSSVFGNEPGNPSPVAVEGPLAVEELAERDVNFALSALLNIVNGSVSGATIARLYSGSLNPGQVSAVINWLDDFYEAFIKIEEGRAAAE